MTEVENLQQQVSQLREHRAAHDVKLANLDDRIVELTTAVTDLTAVLNRGRGAVWALGIAAGAAGAIVTTGIEWLRR